MHEHIALVILLRPLLADITRQPQEGEDAIFARVLIEINASNIDEPPPGVDLYGTLAQFLPESFELKILGVDFIPV
jgi:hypothetical protein